MEGETTRPRRWPLTAPVGRRRQGRPGSTGRARDRRQPRSDHRRRGVPSGSSKRLLAGSAWLVALQVQACEGEKIEPWRIGAGLSSSCGRASIRRGGASGRRSGCCTCASLPAGQGSVPCRLCCRGLRDRRIGRAEAVMYHGWRHPLCRLCQAPLWPGRTLSRSGKAVSGR